MENPRTDPRDYDDDGGLKRTGEEAAGTVWTATARIITAVIGSGVLALPWASAQLGWVIYPIMVLLFAGIICYTSALLSDCYRSGDPSHGERNCTYMDTVKASLGRAQVWLCQFSAYSNVFGVAIGHTIAAGMSMLAIQRRASCFQHNKGHRHPCNFPIWPYMITFGVAEIFLSQIPEYHTWWFSYLGPAMSFTYCSIGVGISIAKVVENGVLKGGLVGIGMTAVTASPTSKVWGSLEALGVIAFVYCYSRILIEIQDTIKAPPPPESKVMKLATAMGVAVTTFLYLLFGFMGYAALGAATPGNLLAGLGFYEPYWVVDIANVAIIVHLAVAYQVYCRPIYDFVERCAARRWPESSYVTREFDVLVLRSSYKLNLFRATWRTAFVVTTTVVAALLPFFHDVVALVGALGFWPLCVYIPVEMYVTQKKVLRWSPLWVWLQILSLGCLFVCLAAMAASIVGIITIHKK
ncbi:unnamed protein product [Triticum turgidum subsp. durum]|uniref:Amino acid transporter transmembrane domain-containing protein n=1 Tax=Triticum turgidum subsp. durum TaxID=4567 RepID=A0A9R0RA14_TRITD|nr:unnamed protein product [Triticum turgidum subsp. durum]